MAAIRHQKQPRERYAAARLSTRTRGLILRGRRASAFTESSMEPIASIKAIAGVIQLAVAPVFLSLASRASERPVDAARADHRPRAGDRAAIPQAKREEQRRAAACARPSTLWTRIDLINWAIRLCVSGALTSAS